MKNCENCARHLGAGACRDNLEGECAAGGGYEAHVYRSLLELVQDNPGGNLHAKRYDELGGYRIVKRYE